MLIYEPPAHGALCCIIPTGGRQRQLYGSPGFKKSEFQASLDDLLIRAHKPRIGY